MRSIAHIKLTAVGLAARNLAAATLICSTRTRGFQDVTKTSAQRMTCTSSGDAPPSAKIASENAAPQPIAGAPRMLQVPGSVLCYEMAPSPRLLRNAISEAPDAARTRREGRAGKGVMCEPQVEDKRDHVVGGGRHDPVLHVG